jgi:hypothetical protein
MLQLLGFIYLIKVKKILQFKNHSNYNCEIKTQFGNTYQVYANWIHNTDQDHWQGWHCNTGSTRLYIDKDLKVFNGECSVLNLGHALDGFDLVDTTVCTKQRCSGCTDDLMTKKYDPT